MLPGLLPFLHELEHLPHCSHCVGSWYTVTLESWQEGCLHMLSADGLSPLFWIMGTDDPQSLRLFGLRLMGLLQVKQSTASGALCYWTSAVVSGKFFFFWWVRVWTQDLELAKQALYHLSHSSSLKMWLLLFFIMFQCPGQRVWLSMHEALAFIPSTAKHISKECHLLYVR
jgi:hypothetical protein